MVLLGSTRANIAVELTGTIQKCSALVHCTARPEPLSARAVVDVACRTISKVAARAERCTTMRAKDVLTETAQGVSLTREATSLPATSLQPDNLASAELRASSVNFAFMTPPWACGLSMRQQDSRFILTPRPLKKHHFVLTTAPEARPLRGKPCLGP